MPTRTYTNADALRASQRSAAGPVPLERRGPELPPGGVYQPDEVSADQLLAEAYESLGRADELGQQTGSRSLASLPGRAADLSVDRQRPSLRALTESIATPAPYLAGASLLPGVQPAGAAAALLSAPDIVRRLIAPEEDESRLGGAVEGALYGAAPFLRGAGGRIKAAYRGLKGAQAATPEVATATAFAGGAKPPTGTAFTAQRPPSLEGLRRSRQAAEVENIATPQTFDTAPMPTNPDVIPTERLPQSWRPFVNYRRPVSPTAPVDLADELEALVEPKLPRRFNVTSSAGRPYTQEF